MSKKNITERNLIDFLLLILQVEGSITLQEFKERVKVSFNLTKYDLSQSPTRPNEAMYEQRCRNLKSHESFPANIISCKDQVFTLI